MKRAFILLLALLLVLSLAGCSLSGKTKEVTMLVYLDEELSEAEARAVGTELNRLPEVTQAQFVSKEEAWNAFLGAQEDPEAFIGLDLEDLRHRFEVTAQTADADDLAERIEEIEGVGEVNVGLELSWFQRMMWKLTQ